MSVTPLRRIGPQDGDDLYQRGKSLIEQMLAERRAKHGADWPLFVSCGYCGDTGIDPESTMPCSCSKGAELEGWQKRKGAWANLIPAHLRDFTLDSHPNGELRAKVQAWLMADPVATGTNLVIIGNVGVGKTGIAIGALRSLHFTAKPQQHTDDRSPDETDAQTYSVRYWNMVSLLDRFREEIGQSSRPVAADEERLRPIRPELAACDALLLDDMATEKPSEWVAERLYSLLNDRYTKALPTIFTSNHKTLYDFERYLGDRVADRVLERCTVIECNRAWTSLRRQK